MIKLLSEKLKVYTNNFTSLIIFLFLMTYFKFLLYVFSYNSIFNPLNDTNISLMSVFRYSIFSLSFSAIIFIFIFIIGFIFFLIFEKFTFSFKKTIYFISFILEILTFLYVYADLQIYKLMGVHLHNNIVLGAINKKDLNNDVSMTSSKVLGFLITPSIYIIFILLFFFLLIYFKSKYKLDKLLQKLSLYLSIPIFLSVFIVMYFWINLNDELTAVPLWSYIESSHISSNFKSNYGDNFNYDDIKIKNKKNVIIIIAESFRKDVFNKDNTPNMFNFITNNKGFIKSKHHFSGAHFTLVSIYSLWHSIWGYHYKATLNKESYKAPIPIKVFNKLGYKTSFLTSSFLVPSFEKFRQATSIFNTYKTFENDSLMMDYFKKSYKANGDTPFLTMIFFNSSHYQYLYPSKFSKYIPALEENDNKLFSKTISYGKNYKYKEKLINRYKNSVLYIDSLFKEVLDSLSEYDKKNTIIVFIGDHGEEFWDHGYMGHTRVSYIKEVVEVPLIFYIPGLNKNVEIDVSTHTDIMTTILSYITNIKDDSINSFFNGISLLNPKSVENHNFIVSSYSFMGLKSKIALINSYGKLILESKTNKIKDKNLFKILEVRDFEDKAINSKDINLFETDFFKFKKSYLKFIIMDEK